MDQALTNPILPIPVVMLAAGGASRFGGDKLNQILRGKRLIDWAVDAAMESRVGPVSIIVRPGRQFDGLPKSVRQIENPDWQNGLSTSVRVGAHSLGDCLAAIFAPADQPTTPPELYCRLVSHFGAGSPVVVATFSGLARNPVLLGREMWHLLDGLAGDHGLRDVVRDAHAIFVECGDLCENVDVDTPSDLQRLAMGEEIPLGLKPTG